MRRNKINRSALAPGRRARKLTVKPLCPFLAGYIAKHPEYADLLRLDAPKFARIT